MSRILVCLPVIIAGIILTTTAKKGKLSQKEATWLQKNCGKRIVNSRFKVSCKGGTVKCERPHITQFPWAVRVLTPAEKGGGDSPCSGTLISKRHVLTAAHCIYNIFSGAGGSGLDSKQGSFQTECEEGSRDREDRFDEDWQKKPNHNSWKVQIGVTDKKDDTGTVMDVASVHIHDKWCKRPKGFTGSDLALITLTKDIPSGLMNRKKSEDTERRVWPACLPAPDEQIPRKLNVAGFGQDAHSQASKGEMLLANVKRKGEADPEGFFTIGAVFSSVCAIIIKGDSGAGLTNAGVLYGVVSLGMGCGLTQNPQKQGKEVQEMRKKESTMISDVRQFRDWICDSSGICE